MGAHILKKNKMIRKIPSRSDLLRPSPAGSRSLFLHAGMLRPLRTPAPGQFRPNSGMFRPCSEPFSPGFDPVSPSFDRFRQVSQDACEMRGQSRFRMFPVPFLSRFLFPQRRSAAVSRFSCLPLLPPLHATAADASRPAGPAVPFPVQCSGRTVRPASLSAQAGQAWPEAPADRAARSRSGTGFPPRSGKRPTPADAVWRPPPPPQPESRQGPQPSLRPESATAPASSPPAGSAEPD